MLGMAPLLLLLWVGVTVSTEVDLQKRIIGGQQCGPDERHYHVRLNSTNTTHESMCGGSLISDQWILTAAHCWEPGWTMYAELNVHPDPDRRQEVEIRAAPVIFTDNAGGHDIMLLKLPNRVPFQLVPLPDCNNPPNIGAMVQIAGYASRIMGPNNERQPGRSNTLQCANIEVVDCQGLGNGFPHNHPRDHGRPRHQQWFCGQTPGVDVCYGDSGGGVVYKRRIYGVISFTGNGTHACVRAAGFVNVCHEPYLQWIQNIIITMAHLKPLLFVLWIGVTVSTEVDLQKRIIGGRQCEPNERHYHVKLLAKNRNNKWSLCGGSLISDQWILSAAHCWEPGRETYVVLGVHPGPGVKVEIKEEPVIYTEKDRNNNMKTHDIMLIKLQNPYTGAQPVRLPKCQTCLKCLEEPKKGRQIQVAGFGMNAVDKNNQRLKSTPKTLQCAYMPVVGCRTVKDSLAWNKPDIPYKNWLCVKAEAQDICPGDSGGGAVYNNMIYGIITGGHATHACVEPSHILRVCAYMKWIEDTTGIKP
ncbi:enteropeptidase-like [Toxotes jaculatrix]|uniref:enteropeptidase-like n=1 Tax=Toxotes jaculatrix TaxID=941984 RepID=UPI001B3AC4C6|nr:enteropeptidase-like [Toxotes jaculatrix]